MGFAIATALLSAGFGVIGLDVRPDATEEFVRTGGSSVTSIADLVRRARAVGVVVANDRQLTGVANDIVAAQPSDLTVLIHSTVLPATVQDIASALARANVPVLDAPVSGGAEKASRGMLTVLIGGEEPSIRHCDAYLNAIGAEVVRVGGVGAGQVVKLANNCLSIAGYELQLEVMQLAAAYGVDEDEVVSAVTKSQGDSRGIRTWGRMDRQTAMKDPKSTKGVPMTKDLLSAVEAADERGLDLPLIRMAHDLAEVKLEQRRAVLTARGSPGPIPLCERCGQELAVPFRAHGRHPECMAQAARPDERSPALGPGVGD
jgi:3-hydroxyisobutyrate dehydrogenase-like beta-hydroxyacid dehydrogenase